MSVAAVPQGLHDRKVSVGEVHVLADQADPYGLGRDLRPPHQRLPPGKLRLVPRPAFRCTPPGQAQELADITVEPLFVQGQRDLIEVWRVHVGDDRLFGDVAQERDLRLQSARYRAVAAEDDHVGLDAPGAQLGHRVLGGLGLLLTRRPEVGDESDMYEADAVPADVVADLADRLQERQDLDVADGPSDLGDDDVDVLGAEAPDAVLDLVGDVGDHLDGLAEVLAPPFLGDDRLVDRPGSRVGVPREGLVYEPLVVTEVEVGFAAVVGHEDLAMLEGVHRPRVDVDVGVQLLHRHPEAPALQQPAQ